MFEVWIEIKYFFRNVFLLYFLEKFQCLIVDLFLVVFFLILVWYWNYIGLSYYYGEFILKKDN